MDRSVIDSQGRRPPTLLGFFLQPTPSPYEALKSRFLPTSDEGVRLKEGEWGTLDESLNFIGRTAYICKSSGGFLLCCFELDPPQNYCICNPVTREWRPLPKPNGLCHYVDVAFSCRGSPDRAHFTVVRARSSEFATRELELETFSSETGEWRESRLVCARPFNLRDRSFESDGVIYWVDTESRLLAYDLATERSAIIEPPPGGNFSPCSEMVGPSEGGRILYARHDDANLEVWVLETRSEGGFRHEYALVARVSLAGLFQLSPEMAQHGKAMFDHLEIKAVDPRDGRRVLLRWNYERYWYNIEGGEVDKLANTIANRSVLVSTYLPYEWPSAS